MPPGGSTARGGVGPVGGDRRVIGAVAAEHAAAVGLEEVGTAVDGETDLVLLAGGLVLGQVLAVGHRGDVLEEAALVRRLGGEVDGEASVGATEPAVHVAVAHRQVAPLVDVDIGIAKEWVVASRWVLGWDGVAQRSPLTAGVSPARPP